MVQADVRVYSQTGGSDNTPGTETDISNNAGTGGDPNLRFKTNDNDTVDTNDPIPIPATGSNYSYWKHLYLKVFAINDATQINNIKFFTDGGNFGTGITTRVGDQYPVRSSTATTGYELATGTAGTTGDEMTQAGPTGHADVTSATDAFTYTSGSPLAPTDASIISEAGNIINATNETTNYFVFQMQVASTASPGDLANETWTWQYDEI